VRNRDKVFDIGCVKGWHCCSVYYFCDGFFGSLIYIYPCRFFFLKSIARFLRYRFFNSVWTVGFNCFSSS